MSRNILLGLTAIAILVGCRRDPDLPYLPGTKTQFKATIVNPANVFPESTFGMPSLPIDNPFTVEGIYLGRMLFYDPILSFDSTISCGSCHSQKNAFADSKPFSSGIYGFGTTRNTSSLINLAYSKKFFWDARQNSLRELVFEPIQAHNEMAMTLPVLSQKLAKIPRYVAYFDKAFGSQPNIFDMSKALELFLMTLVSKNSRYDDFFPGKFSLLNNAEKRGALLFNGLVNFDASTGLTSGADCFHCHGGALAQQNNPNMGGIANNGLDANFIDKGYGGITNRAMDRGTFKTPTLLNIAVSGPYMHDGRFTTLEQVINHYSDNVQFQSATLNPMMSAHSNQQLKLSAEQKTDLKAFLLTMTDTVFLSNPAYGNPFKK
ncbi:MAG: cytochrome-c peroxidase [Flavobacteriaceae bacterium]|nr:cytochrome-c peroxidase [Flavobacteriaceae bacterium]